MLTHLREGEGEGTGEKGALVARQGLENGGQILRLRLAVPRLGTAEEWEEGE